MNRTGIEYLDFTWNPLAMKCDPVSEACQNCWHLKMARRLAGNRNIPRQERLTYQGKALPVLREYELLAPLRRKKPAIIGVQFMGDLLHTSASLDHINGVFRVMRKASHHTFLVLTKRPEQFERLIYNHEDAFGGTPQNILLGITAENQRRLEERIYVLFSMAKYWRKWLCAEPLLGPLDLEGMLVEWDLDGDPEDEGVRSLPGIEWVVAGGETGRGARATHPDWVRSIRDQCLDAEIPFYFKSWGEWIPARELPHLPNSDPGVASTRIWPDCSMSYKVGRKVAGRLLDGRTWDGLPKE